ncbi:WD40 repeat-like protein [Dacryopinax primogenitus]|uniref:WD40 repeat-like protein n=1 Tax=Dacryopinax primogenitus (strain DJM 731) TaxID=1858805 RepID=M5GC16_DACPD|nr:WD40 repeat-like protein [Dacryopinax primogenitus]EJU06015.1 WD40 repeat-like protein [Dacryopinax primogenitus]
MDYKPVVIQKQPRSAAKHNPESRYWRRFKNPVFVKEHAPVTCIHFSPSRPHRYAVTASTRVQVYAPRTQKVVKTISRFKDVARSGHIRGDGKLLVAGDDTGLIQLFDMSTRAILRSMDDHKQPVHVTKFSPDNTSLLSCSDDATVRLFDVPSQTCVGVFRGHTDYVRSGVVSPSNPSLILSGSYDGTMRLFDSRTGGAEIVMACKTPVEDVLLFPSGGIALSASGAVLRVWDLVAGGRCLRALSNHQKTVTSLAFNGDASRVLSGGLDQMVKVYDVTNYKVVHSMRYPAPVLSLALSPDDTHLAAGMTDGSFSIRRRQPKASEVVAEDKKKEALRTGAYEFFMGGELEHLGEGKRRTKQAKQVRAVEGEVKVRQAKRKTLKKYDMMLKKFQYEAALDTVLQSEPPTVVFSLVQELAQRDGLRTALAGRDEIFLEPVLRLLLKHVADPRFSNAVCDVAAIVLDIYRDVIAQSPLVDRLLRSLQRKVDAELKFQNELRQLQGALDMIIASAALSLPGITL